MFTRLTLISLLAVICTNSKLFVASGTGTNIASSEEVAEIWDSHCKSGLSSKHGSRVRCSDASNKIYLFDATKKDFDSARNYCRQQFAALPFGDLVAIADCPEFLFIREMLLKIREDGGNLMTGDDPITIWTSGYETPDFEDGTGSRPAVRRTWLTSDGSDYVNLDELCADTPPSNNSDTPTIEHNAASPGDSSGSKSKILTLNYEKDKSGDYTFSTEFRPWDLKHEQRYTLCEFQMPNRNVTGIGTTTLTPLEPVVTTVTAVTTDGTTVQTTTEEMVSVATEPAIPVTHPTRPTTVVSLVTTTPGGTPVSPRPALRTTARPSTTDMTTQGTTNVPDYSEYVDYHELELDSSFVPGGIPLHEPTIWPPRCKPWMRSVCPAGTVGMVYQYCDSNGRAQIFRDCRQNWFKEIDHEIDKKRPVVEITGHLVSNLTNSANTTAGDVVEYISMAKKLHVLFDAQMEGLTPVRRQQKANDFSRKLIKGFSVILEDDSRKAWTQMTDDNRTSVASNILSQVHETAYKLGCHQPSTGQYPIKDANINLETFVFDHDDLSNSFVFPSTWTSSGPQTSRVKFTKSLAMTKEDNCDHYVASGVIYKQIGQHLAVRSDLANNGSNVRINSNLVAFSLNNDHKVRRPLPNGTHVQITLSHKELIKYGDTVSCVFWDFKHASWSSSGCSKLIHSSFRNQTTCECTHLTNFAVLMDMSNREDNDSEVKHILTIVCCAFSSVSLMATILLLSFVKSLRNRRSIITNNLCFCLLVVNLLVIVGLDRTENVVTCRLISALLLYALLSAFGWMLMEGYFLYQMIILVFRSVGYLNTFWLYFVGYVPSLITVVIYVSITGWNGLYDETFGYFCWISNRVHKYYIWAFTGPALTVVLINIVILIMSFKEALKANKRRPTSPITTAGLSDASNTSVDSSNHKMSVQVVKRWLKGWTSLMILVGATWVVGVLYIHELVAWFSYVFIVMNALQGVFILLFEIVLNSKARSALVKAISGQLNLKYKTSTVSKTTSNLTIRTKSSSSANGQQNNGNGQVVRTISEQSSRSAGGGGQVALRHKRSNDISMEPQPDVDRSSVSASEYNCRL